MKKGGSLRVNSPLIILMVPVAGIFAYHVGSGFPKFLFYAAALLVAGSFLWTWATGRWLETWIHSDGRRFRVGDELPLELRMENHGLLPVPWLGITDKSEGAEPYGTFISVGPFRYKMVRHRVPLNRRGRYPLGPMALAYGDPFGIFRGVRTLTGKHPVAVYPRVEPLGSFPLRRQQPFGRRTSLLKAHEDPASLADVRPLQPGDNPRFIHWKVSAKRGELFIKDFELLATTTLMIVLDMDGDAHVGSGPRGTDEKAASLAVSLASRALKEGLPAGLLATSTRRVYVKPAAGTRQFRTIEDSLLEASADGPVDFAAALEAAARARLLPHRASVACITPRVTEELLNTLVRLQRSGYDTALFHLARETFAPGARPELRRAAVLESMARAGVQVFTVTADMPFAAIGAGHGRRGAGPLSAPRQTHAPAPSGEAASGAAAPGGMAAAGGVSSGPGGGSSSGGGGSPRPRPGKKHPPLPRRDKVTPLPRGRERERHDRPVIVPEPARKEGPGSADEC